MVELESNFLPQKGTRRTVLRAGFATAGTLMLGSAFSHTTEARKFCRLDDGIHGLKDAADPVAFLTEEIARKHNVWAISTAEAYAMQGVTIDEEKTANIWGLPPRTWTEPTLTLLNNVLDILPEEFMQPYHGESAHIAFDFLMNSACSCAG